METTEEKCEEVQCEEEAVDKSRLVWRRSAQRYTSSEVGRLGSSQFDFFSVSFDGCVPCEQEDCYRLGCWLPGVAPYLGHFQSAADAKHKAEAMLAFWLKKTGLTYAE